MRAQVTPLHPQPYRLNVRDDVLDDYVSIEAARKRYGVVIEAVDGDLVVDAAATAARRERRQP